MQPEPRLSSWAVYRRFYAGRHTLVTFCVLSSLLRSLLVIPLSLFAREAVDHGLRDSSTGRLWSIGLSIAGLYLGSAILGLLVRIVTAQVTVRATAELRERLSVRLYLLPRSEITSQEATTIHSVIVQDTERISVLSRSVITSLLPSSVTVVALVAYLIVVNPVLGLVLCSIAPVLVYLNRRLRQMVEDRGYDFRQSLWLFNQTVLRSLRIWDLTTAQHTERDELAKTKRRIDGVGQAAMRQEWAAAIYENVQTITVGVSVVIVMLVGGLAVHRGSMTVGTFLSFFVVMALAQSAGKGLLASLPGTLAGREALASVAEWLDDPARPVYTGCRQAEIDGSFRFEDVSFSYGEQPVLRHVDLDVAAGTTIGIAGPNGAGKTTLVNLLLGWYGPDEGRVVASGVPLEELAMDTWHDAIALVHQSPPFFSGTVRENLVYGRSTTTDEELWEAARIATADVVLQELEQGLETPMGDDGVLLSGGQRQRITLTHAVLRQPRLLVLDEPTNHVDRPSVRQLLRNLKDLAHSPTVVLITHDVDVLATVDVVYEMPGRDPVETVGMT